MIVVHNQSEMNATPEDYNEERILIKGNNIDVRGNRKVCVIDTSSVTLWDNAKADLYDSARATLHDTSEACLCGNSRAVLSGYSRAYLYQSSTAYLHEHSYAELHDHTEATLFNSSRVFLCYHATAALYEESSAILYGNAMADLNNNAKAELHDMSKAVLFDKAIAKVYDNANVEIYDDASVEMYGNSQVLNKSDNHNIKAFGNSRIIYLPKNIQDYLNYYNIRHNKITAILYKAVRKINNRYVSDHDRSFEYVIGEDKIEECDVDIKKLCSFGIHVAPLDWVLRFSREWDDIAILEVETKIDDIVIPEDSDGKVRTSKIRVIREVPLEECGILGRIMLLNKGEKE